MKFAREFGRLSKKVLRQPRLIFQFPNWTKRRFIKLLIILLGPVLPEIIAEITRTGKGAEKCLELGCLPMPVNYYSPVPNISDLEEQDVWSRKSDLAGIEFRSIEQLKLLEMLGKLFGDECKWPYAPTKDPSQFFIRPDIPFSSGCASVTHSIIRMHTPRRIIEFGSGNSSKIIAAAILRNSQDNPDNNYEYTIIDPYPNDFIRNNMLPGVTQLIQKRAELVDVTFFHQLEENDILFIDSSHVVKIGGDVNFAILDILPTLKPGVIIHFHDIPMPYEYHKVYITGRKVPVFWTESYLLQAFLIYNNQFEVMLALRYLMTDHQEKYSKAFPHYDPVKEKHVSESLWIRRKCMNI